MIFRQKSLDWTNRGASRCDVFNPRRIAGTWCLALALVVSPVAAQERQANETQLTALKITYTTNGAILQGSAAKPARIKSPELDVTAVRIQFERSGESLRQVTAHTNVNIKLDLPSKAGSPSHIEANSNTATLEVANRTLVLKGNVDGWYQVGDGGRNTLRGETVKLTFAEGDITAAIEGGARGVRIALPAQTTGSGSPSALGSVVITAQKAFIEQRKGIARFEGNAYAVSNDAPTKFNLRARDFIIKRDPKTGALDNMKTVGRTHINLDLPAEAPGPKKPPATAVAGTAAVSNTAATGTNANPPTGAKPDKFTAPSLGRPTHLEVDADVVTVTRPNNLLMAVLEGNVTGSYRLATESGPSPDYRFDGGRVEITELVDKADPKKSNFALDFSGAQDEQVTIKAPGFNLNLGGE